MKNQTTYKQFTLPMADQKRRATIALLAFADGFTEAELQKLTDKQLIDIYHG